MERLFLIMDKVRDASGKVIACDVLGCVTSDTYPSDIAEEHEVVEVSKNCHIKIV